MENNPSTFETVMCWIIAVFCIVLFFAIRWINKQTRNHGK